MESLKSQQSESHHKIRQTEVDNEHITYDNWDLHISRHFCQRLVCYSIAHACYLSRKKEEGSYSLLMKSVTPCVGARTITKQAEITQQPLVSFKRDKNLRNILEKSSLKLI